MARHTGLQDLAERLANTLPPGLAGLRDELKDNFRAVLQGRLERLDLVSREQFDVQREVLQRTRERLERLEQQMAVLEAQLDALKTGQPER